MLYGCDCVFEYVCFVSNLGSVCTAHRNFLSPQRIFVSAMNLSSSKMNSNSCACPMRFKQNFKLFYFLWNWIFVSFFCPFHSLFSLIGWVCTTNEFKTSNKLLSHSKRKYLWGTLSVAFLRQIKQHEKSGQTKFKSKTLESIEKLFGATVGDVEAHVSLFALALDIYFS